MPPARPITANPVLTILLPRRLNPAAGRHVIRVVGSMRGASLPRRSWYGIAGAALLVASAAIHLDLYVTGYQSIPTIGWMFLLQVITAFALAIAIPLTGSWVLAGLGAGFALAVAPVLKLGRRMVPAVISSSVVALALLVAAVASPKSQPAVAAGGQTLDARQVGSVMLLTNAKGFTLYWFAPDSPNKSVCYGDCAAYWPPVAGNEAAGPGVTGKIGTISRTDGTTQATYDGHPLYTYVGDNAPGVAAGNNINLNGGLWHDVP